VCAGVNKRGGVDTLFLAAVWSGARAEAIW